MTQEEIDKRIQDLKYQQQRISSSIVKDQEKKLDKIQEFFKKQSDEILNQSKQNLENYRSDIFGPSYDEIKSIFGSDEINMETINYALKNNPENFNNFMLNGSILNNSQTTNKSNDKDNIILSKDEQLDLIFSDDIQNVEITDSFIK